MSETISDEQSVTQNKTVKNLKYPFGVYQKPNGKLFLVQEPGVDSPKGADYEIDENIFKRHKVLKNIKMHVVSRCSGDHFADKHLSKCIYLGELE